MQRQTLLIILTGGYVCLAGIFLIGHVAYPAIDARIKTSLYRQVELRLDELERILERNWFSDHDSIDFYDEHRTDLLQIMRRFRQGHMDRVSGFVVGVTVTAILAGALYLCAGGALIRHSVRTKRFFICAFSAFGVYLTLYSLNAYFEIQFLDRTSVELWQLSSLFEPDMGNLRYPPLVKSLSNFAVTRAALFAVVSTIVFLVIPLYGLTRPAVKAG